MKLPLFDLFTSQINNDQAIAIAIGKVFRASYNTFEHIKQASAALLRDFISVSDTVERPSDTKLNSAVS